MDKELEEIKSILKKCINMINISMVKPIKKDIKSKIIILKKYIFIVLINII